ncbi:MAG: energy-coupling factor ABC transporter ATP-binding protein [Burkholderiales bacterium]
MSGFLVEAEAIAKRFGARTVLDDAALGLARGRGYVLSGDNGSGKTTLLRVLAGLDPAQAGTLRLAGEQATLPRYPDAWRRHVVYVHQHPYLFQTSLLGNIAYGLRARGQPESQWRPIVLEAAKWAGVSHLVKVPPQKLSGGEKQRVALARVKVLAPRLLLLDEPTANLDLDGRRQAIALICALLTEGVTVLIACHDRELIELPQVERLHLERGKIYRADR